MLFHHQDDTYRLYDRGTAVSVDVLEGNAWIEIMYECVPEHKGEKLLVLSTEDLVLIVSTRLTTSLMIQPQVSTVELREIMKPLGSYDLMDATGVGKQLVLLFRGGGDELKIAQVLYRIVNGRDVAMQLADVCCMQGAGSGPDIQRASSFIRLQPMPHSPAVPASTSADIRSPPPPPPPRSNPGRLKCVTTTHKTDTKVILKPSTYNTTSSVYIIVDNPADEPSAHAFQVSLYRIILSSTGMTLDSQSTHTHSLPICNSIAITENSIVLFSQASNKNSGSEYLHYSVHHDTLTEHSAPFLDAYNIQGSLLFIAGIFLLCPQSEPGATVVIDFASELLTMQIRDPTIRSIYPKDDKQRRALLVLQSSNQKKAREGSNMTGEISPAQQLNKENNNMASLLLSPYYSPANDPEDTSLRPYLLSAYSANSAQLSVASIDSFTHPISKPIEEDTNTLERPVDISLEALLYQLIEKYTPNSQKYNSDSLNSMKSTDCRAVYPEEVQLEIQSLSKHTRRVMMRNQERIQGLQTGADNPYIALHDLMLSLSNDAYMWMQKQMVHSLLYFLPISEFPERDVLVHSYHKHRQLAGDHIADEISGLSMQLGSYFISSNWSIEVQRMLVHTSDVIASSKANELEKHDPNFLSSLHFVLAMLSNFNNSSADCYGKTKLTTPLEYSESTLPVCQSDYRDTHGSLKAGPTMFPSDATYMQIFVYITLLSGLFRKTIVAENRCYSVQRDQIRTTSQLEQGITYNLVFPAYASPDDNKLFTEAVWIPFITQTEFSLPSLR